MISFKILAVLSIAMVATTIGLKVLEIIFHNNKTTKNYERKNHTI